MAVSAFVLVDVMGDHTKSAFKTITRIPGVKHVYVITGPHDLIVDIEAETMENGRIKFTKLPLEKSNGESAMLPPNTRSSCPTYTTKKKAEINTVGSSVYGRLITRIASLLVKTMI